MDKRRTRLWLYDLLFLLVLALAGYLRLTGVDWGEGQHQHPDENFFSSVLMAVSARECAADASLPVDLCPPEQRRWIGIGQYLDNKTSPLSPYNRGYSFYVYGNLPMTLTRVAADIAQPSNLRLFGRQVSALADLFAILFLYLLVSRLYGPPVALLASLFSALTVMQIQQSHFFTGDLFVNTFAFLALWCAVAILEHRDQRLETRDPVLREEAQEEIVERLESNTDITSPAPQPQSLKSRVSTRSVLTHPLFLLSIGFGFALGMAMASKINIAPLAVALPGAFVLRYLIQKKESGQPIFRDWSLNTDYWTLVTLCLVAGGVATVLSFRIFQPYAFEGIGLNPQWVQNIREQRLQAAGKADVPWELQWARRNHLYSFENLTIWGFGLPLGILAWTGFLYMGWRIWKGEWRHALLWGWTAAYFAWQSLQFNPTMRYQLPVYPLLAMMAAWFIYELAGLNVPGFKRSSLPTVVATLIGVTVLGLTAAWAFAFHSIYLRDEPRMAASHWIYQNIPGPINLHIESNSDGAYNQPLPFPTNGFIRANRPYDTSFFAQRDGVLEEITLGHAVNKLADTSTLTLTLSQNPGSDPEQALGTATLTSEFDLQNDPRGDSHTLTLDEPVILERGSQYYLRLEIDEGILEITGASVANETTYDYPLPFRVDNYDAFSGIYRGDLTLEVYWDDNLDKLNRFVTFLNDTDYILIPTNHQYAQITRLPERYPLTTLYYRELIGCPGDNDIIWCYRVAKPGMFEGRLGFDLVAVFETYPTLGPVVINDQAAEEAFTFYDHPKAMIFKKNEDFDIGRLQSILSSVDVTKAVRLSPRQFDDFSTLLLPEDKLAQQRAGGTWSELFDYDWPQNRYPILGMAIWYLFIFVLGLAVYPLVRLAMPGLADKGYPLSRVLGLILFGYLAWLAGSVNIPYTRLTIAIIFGLLILVGALLAYYQRQELRQEWQSRWKYFLLVEGLFLAFFAFDLIIRIGNPDLWHPAKGGERPMDFSYFNAVLKSTVFPPYDPWFAGGYINYYYYGFVLVGTPVKLLGIVPSIAYNFILPTLFAMVGISAFSLGWNLVKGHALNLAREQGAGDDERPDIFDLGLIAGLAASALTLLLGNLGTIQLIYQKLQELGAMGKFSWEPTVSIFQRWSWALRGFILTLQGGSLPIGYGDWYWNPSRVVPPLGGNEITEFPLFTFIYSDLHAHMIAIPLALLAVSWALSVVAGRARWRNTLSAALGLGVGGLIIGVFYPTNLSDAYTYLLLGMVAIGYTILSYSQGVSLIRRIVFALGAVIGLYLLSQVLYGPYRAWYSQAYSALDPWKGPFTPIGSYLTHWGVFLFILVSWMAWETREWMAAIPVSALGKLKPYSLLIEGSLVAFALALLVLAYLRIRIGWIALPLAAWAAILLLRPGLSDAKRFVLFLVGTGLLITVVVELVVVSGDIGRQNTIFKFYIQAWLLLAASAAAAFAWTLPAFFRWLPGWRLFWQTAMIFLISGAALFTITGTAGKVRDRWIPEAPRTLDSMTYMQYALYDDYGKRLTLREDYRAIRWMQDNVSGSPVIVEASNCIEYHWCTRVTMHTGLPGVIGWNWHQRQQRVYTSTWVEGRVAEVGDFYDSIDVISAREFLERYNVRYIVVGQLERAAYTPQGIAKFERFEGELWQEAYRDGQTAIYEVIQ